MNQSRLTRIEASLTPKQAVLMWLRQEHQGKSSDEYVRWLIQRPPSCAPRPRLEKQVAETIRVAMKGQDLARVQQAVRQAQMYADFLILLVNKTNWAVLADSRSRWLEIALLYEQLRNVALSDDEEEAINQWAVHVREFAIEMLSLQETTELIQNKYFDGEFILLQDAVRNMQQQIQIVRKLLEAYDRVIIQAGKEELATDFDKLQRSAKEQVSEKVGFITALARSKSLDDFGEPGAADAILRPYIIATR
jgi:hypothetical protein